MLIEFVLGCNFTYTSDRKHHGKLPKRKQAETDMYIWKKHNCVPSQKPKNPVQFSSNSVLAGCLHGRERERDRERERWS